MNETDVKTDVRALPCPLTDDEVRLRGIELAERNTEYANTKEEAKESAKGFREKLENVNNEIHRLKNAVSHAVEVRDVEVQITINRYLGTVSIMRMDTGDVIEKRAMTPSEAQGHLDMGDSN